MNATTRLVAVLAASACVAALGACGDDDDDERAAETAGAAAVVPTTTTTTTASPVPPPSEGSAGGDVELTGDLSHTQVVPGPGVADGSGIVRVTFSGDQLCHDINVAMGEKPTAAHIHKGAAGQSGAVVVELSTAFTAGETGFVSEACRPLPPDAAGIKAAPSNYYVNIHTAAHPEGAVRAQL
ncbi:MAG: CHRD domain-containing protein [Acidimicrobiia bacterium]